MKKSILTSIFALTAILSYSIPIISVTQQCGGLFGYSYIEFHREVYMTGADGTDIFGWVGDCNGRGFRSCKPPTHNGVLNNDLDPIEADQYDQSRAGDLIAQIAPTIGEHNTTGSETSTMVVVGQTFKRVYTISWNAIPSVCLDEVGNNGETFSTTFICSVEYVQL